MKRIGFLIEKIADIDNLRLAFWKARKGKSYSAEVTKYRKNLEENLLALRQQILSGEVKVGNYRYFKVFEPKERQICASAFNEQVLHHALMNVCHCYFEAYQINESYASRKGKGTYAALEKAKAYTERYNHYLKLDVKKFFESIEHDVLKKQLRRMFKDATVLHIFDAIIDSYAVGNANLQNPVRVLNPDRVLKVLENRGVPIGNLTSQYFANHFLAVLDHYIKEDLAVAAYVRYMDDMVIWHNDKTYLLAIRDKIKSFLEDKLLCRLKPEALNYCEKGLPFLGYFIFPNHIRLLQQSKQRFIRKMNLIEKHYHNGNWSASHCKRKALPLLAFVQHADTIGFRKSVLALQ
jgi:RNA-directed DNA polymerase